MHRQVVIEKKPKIIKRNLNDVIISWENVFKDDTKLNKFILQKCDDVKEWKTIYCGRKHQFKVYDLAPCTCYSFRIKLEDQNEWINFKAATEDTGPYNFVMHMSRAVKLGKMPLIRKMFNARPHLLETENRENKTPLIQAIETCDIHLVQLLLTLGASLNKSLSFNKRTPLMIAIYKGFLNIATVLIDKGANSDAKDINGLTAMHYAVDSNNLENVKFCVEHSMNVNCPDNSGWTPLIRAGLYGKIIQQLWVSSIIQHTNPPAKYWLLNKYFLQKIGPTI